MTEAALEAGARDWGIVAASLRSPETRDALGPQDGLYTVATREDDSEELRVIGALRGMHVAPEDPGALLAAMADPRIRIVSLTVTEKGYCHDPATGALDAAHPDIRHDLAVPDAPRSAPGFLAAALRRRRAAGTPPFTVLCCDNLPHNGATLRRVVTQLATHADRDLGAWIGGEVAFPCTMVDRIVPATTDQDRARIGAALGLADAWPVVGERFAQWVIEDDFRTGRPDWTAGGATFAADVAPFELMKLRLLNGAHSALAYLGLLAGHATVAEAAGDPALGGFLQGFWAEVAPTVPAPPGVVLEDYAAQLLRRFRNRALRHLLAQIAMDGSQKLPQRLLGPARERLARGLPVPHLALAVAAWIRHLDGQGGVPVRDPLAAQLGATLAAAPAEPAARARAVLAFAPVFGTELGRHARFAAAVGTACRVLAERGPAAALAMADR